MCATIMSANKYKRKGTHLKITDVNIKLIDKKENKLKAVATITIDDCFVVHDIKVIEGRDGYFVAMPTKKTPDGEYRDIAHAINSETRTMLVTCVLDAFNKAMQ